MKSRTRDVADIVLLLVLSLLVLWVGLGSSRLWDQDEGYYASVASEMYARGDWLVPTFNEELFAHKPPLMYWGMLLGFEFFGVNEFAARCFSAVFGMGMVLLTYWLGLMLFNRKIGFIASIVLLSSLMFTVVARSATADAHLGFFVLLAIALWVEEARRRQTEVIPVQRASRWFAIYSAIALAILAKGPIGFAFPIAILGTMTLMWNTIRGDAGTWDSKDWDNRGWNIRGLGTWSRELVGRFPQAFLSMRPALGAGVILAVAGPWFYWMQWKTGGEFFNEFFGVHHFGRFSQAMDNHSGPIYYYVLSCLIGFFPWTSFAIPIAMYSLRSEQWREHRLGMVLTATWIAFYFGIFSIASTKLPNYVIPAYPAVAIGIATYFANWMCIGSKAANERSESLWARAGWGFMFLSGLLLIVGGIAIEDPKVQAWVGERFSVDRLIFPAIGTINSMGWVLLVGSAVGFALVQRSSFSRATWVMCGVGSVFTVMLWQRVVPAIDRFQTPQTIAMECLRQDRVGRETPVVFGMFRPSMVFYSKRPIAFQSSENVGQVVQAERPEILVVQGVSSEQEHTLQELGYRQTRRYRSFPKRGWATVYRLESGAGGMLVDGDFGNLSEYVVD